MPVPFASQNFSESFTKYLALRRESLLWYLEQQGPKTINKQFIDLFLNELRLAFTGAGLETIAYGFQDAYFSSSLTGLLMRLYSHCDSDEDLWAALKSGCLRDRELMCEGDLTGAFGPVADHWWASSMEPMSFDAVVQEWEAALEVFVKVAKSSYEDLKVSEWAMNHLGKTMQSDFNRAEEMLKDTSDAIAHMDIQLKRWYRVVGREE